MKEKKFRKLQRRRAQTEARIGILKANFLGQPMRAKGFKNRELALAWGVFEPHFHQGRTTTRSAGRDRAYADHWRRSGR